MSAAPQDRDPLRVAYILKMFPRLSETFILNELLELEARGVEASVFSLMHPNDGRFHGRVAELALTVEFVPREKPDAYWARLRHELREFAPGLDRWERAANFLERHRIPKDFDLLLRSAVIAARLKATNVQHVHAHFATISTRVAALVHLMTGLPFSFTSHAKDIYRDTVDRELYRELVELSSFNITVSDFNRTYILEQTPGVDAEKVVRLYNGIDLTYFRPDDSERDPRRVLSVGRLVPKKGFDFLLRAARILADRGSQLRITIAGDGEDRDALHALHRELRLESSVEFVGALPQEQVRSQYHRSGLTALACVPDSIGNRDALPTTLLESLACGLPAVSTQLTGVPEIIDESVGAVVPPEDPEALADAIAAVAERADTLRAACRTRAEERFDLVRNAGSLATLFAESASQ